MALLQLDRNSPELHLMITWERGRYRQKKIFADIQKRCKILECYEVEWSDDTVANNFTRFYGVNLPDGSGKEQDVGRGKFLLLLLLNENPVYEVRLTSRGEERVNTVLFDAKMLYRSWTGGGCKIHATNNPKETDHDLSLLLGINYIDYMKVAPKEWNGEIKPLRRDLSGAHGWESLKDFFIY